MKTPKYKRVRELFYYFDDGYLCWRINRTNGVSAGDIAGNMCKSTGYFVIGIDGIQYQLHRIIFLWHHGYMPEHDIDHRDKDQLNNKIGNLREITEQCNMRNSKIGKRNKSGVVGVCFSSKVNKWNSYIHINNKHICLGRFMELDDAVRARYHKEIELNWNGCNSTSSSYLYLKNKGIL